MSDSSKRLSREAPVRRTGRVIRREDLNADDLNADDLNADGRGSLRREGRRNRRERAEGAAPTAGPRDLRGDVMDLQRGVLYAGIEAIAATVDTASGVLRNAVDRSLSGRYRQPGDLVRGVGGDLSDAARDVIDGVGQMPDRLNERFYEAVPRRQESPARGERKRRAAQTREED
ncbi:MAG: hypothetical protein AAFV53_00550 [Myxococcota bacterium]